MWRRAIARHAPPTKYRLLPAASRSTGAPAIPRSIVSATALRLSSSSARRSGPSGRLTPAPIGALAPESTRTSSTLPPPRSPTTPSALRIPAKTPAADNLASSLPAIMRTGTPHWRCASAAKASPSLASRTAAVAMIARWSTFSARASATKRCRLAKASSMPSGLSRPVRRRGDPASGPGISARHQPRLAAPQGLAAPGEARIGHEIGVGREAVFLGGDPRIRAVRRQVPALQRIAQIGHHDLVEDLAMHGHILDRHQRLDAPIEIARHPVGRADEHLGLVRRQPVAVAEADDPAMFEKASDDALDPDIVRHSGNARPQATDPTHHEVDADPALRGLVQEIDDRRVDERIELGPYLRRLAGPRIFYLGLDQLGDARPQVDRRHRDLRSEEHT